MPLTLSQLLYLCMQGNSNMRPGGATVARLTPVQMVACSHHVRVNHQFLRVDAFDIISIVICACNETLISGLEAQW